MGKELRGSSENKTGRKIFRLKTSQELTNYSPRMKESEFPAVTVSEPSPSFSLRKRKKPTTVDREKRSVPSANQFVHTNLLAIYWDQPVSVLTGKDGRALPGIKEKMLPEDRTQSLGVFLAGKDNAVQTFVDFQQHATHDTASTQSVLDNLKKLCPSPKELLQKNTKFNWVPWETFIAYGDVLLAKKGGINDEKIAQVVSGQPYLEKVEATFPDGSPNKRTEIVLERQNKDPKSQGILEAISNSVDAISEREKIGQFGLGVKQVFSWLEKGKGEVQVITRAREEATLSFRARKGHDGQIYVKFDSPSQEELTQFASEQTGTMIKLTGIRVDSQRQVDINTKLHERFRYVPETTIAVNGAEINGHEEVKVVGRKNAITPRGKIDITINTDEITITDNGSGMDQQTLFKMFMPGYGKGFRALSATEAKRIAKEQAEVLLVNEENPRIVFSRNRESDFSVAIPKDRVNTSSQTICLELGRVLKVSEGRDGFEIDANFAVAVPILVEKTLRDTTLTDSEKTSFVNSLLLGIDQLSGTVEGPEDKIGAIVKKAKAGIRTASLPYMRELQEKGTILLPNYTDYQRVAVDAQFVDPYLLRGLGDTATVLQKEGLQRLKLDEGITTKDGWKVLAAPFEENEATQDLASQVQQKDKLAQLKTHLADVLPVIVDKENRIVVVDQKVWHALDQQTDPLKKAYLQESLQTILNEKVHTSYESTDPRSIFLRDAEKGEQTPIEEGVKMPEEDRVEFIHNSHTVKNWTRGDRLYSLEASGTMKIYDITSREVVDTVAIDTFKDGDIIHVQPTEKGTWVLQQNGNLVLLDVEGNAKEKYSVPAFMSTLENGRSISSEGKIVTTELSQKIDIFDPHTQQIQSYTTEHWLTTHSPLLTTDNKLLLTEKDTIIVIDTLTGNKIVSPNQDVSNLNHTVFFTHDNKIYLAGRNNISNLLNIFEVTQQDGLVSTKPFSLFTRKIDDSTRFAVATDEESGIVTVRYSNTVTLLQKTPTRFEVKETLKKNNNKIDEDMNDISYAANALKDLFGDTSETLYGNALGALRSRFNNSPLERAIVDPAIMLGWHQSSPYEKLQSDIYDIPNEWEPAVDKESYSKRPKLINYKGDYKEVYNRIQEDIENFEYIKGSPKTRNIEPLNVSKPRVLASELADLVYVSEENKKKSMLKPLQNKRIEQFITTTSSEKFREAFSPLWERIKDETSMEEQQRLKMRFIRNAPLVLDIPEQTSEIMQLFFLSDNPQVFFDQTPEHRQQITGMLDGIDSIAQKESLIKFATIATRGKSQKELDSMYKQMGRLFEHEQIKANFLDTITRHASELSQAVTEPSKLSITNPLRAYMLFVSNEADLLRTKEELFATDGYTDILATDVPLEVLAYFRLAGGHTTIDEINKQIIQEGGVSALGEKFDLSHYQDEIRKAIHAQSVEPGVAKRELLQNALYAIREKDQDAGVVTVDFYLRDNGKEFVEEITDSGTGIEHLISFLVPGTTSKDTSEGLGIFGTGFYKTLEDVDHVEVDTVTQNGKQTSMVIELTKDAEGVVQRGTIKKIQTRTVSKNTETGTSIRLIKKTDGQLPELDAMIAKNTYLTMGGLAVSPEVADSSIQLSYVGENARHDSMAIPITDHSVTTLNGIGEIKFVKAPSLPSAMTHMGLRMSPLSQVSSDYLQEVPDALKTFLTDEHISIVLPRSVPLVKDRSRIANEEAYLPAIQQAVATETVKRAAYALLNDTAVNVRGLIPEDILTNQSYYKTLTSEAGVKAYGIAQKINKGELLDKGELNYIHQEGQKDNLLLVLIGVEQTTADGKKDSLLRRFQYIQEKAGNKLQSKVVALSLGVDTTQTAVTPKLAQLEQHLVPFAKDLTAGAELRRGVTFELEMGRRPSGVTTLSEAAMDEKEKEVMIDYFNSIGFTEVYFVPQEKMGGAEGSCDGNKLFLNSTLLEQSPRDRVEVITHETAHLFERREQGMADGAIDTEADKKSEFTHQQEGPFAQHYKLAATIIQQQIIK